jgi:hypothetical protein
VTDRHTIDTINSDQLDQLYDRLEALRQVARGYCPACGRGDAAPTVADWEQQKTRASQAEELLAIAHQTSNRAEAERARAAATVARIRDSAASLHSRGIDAMSASFILDIIDGRRDEPARTTAKNRPTSEDTGAAIEETDTREAP